MDQLKVLQMTVQKIQGEPVGGHEALERDMFPLKDVTSLLAVEKRLREEADLKNKMVTQHYCEYVSVYARVSYQRENHSKVKNVWIYSLLWETKFLMYSQNEDQVSVGYRDISGEKSK